MTWDYLSRVVVSWSYRRPKHKYEIEKIKSKRDRKEEVPDFDDEDSSKKKKNVVHLFVGNFDLKKFFDNEQLIKTKESEFCKTFIFSTVSKREHKHKSYTQKNTLNTKTIGKTKRNNMKLCKETKQKLPIKLHKQNNKLTLNDSIGDYLKTRNSTNEYLNSNEHNINTDHTEGNNQHRLFTIQHYNSTEQHNWSLNQYNNTNYRNKSTLSSCRNNTLQNQHLNGLTNKHNKNYPIQFPRLGNKHKKQKILLLKAHFNNKNYFTKNDLYYGE